MDITKEQAIQALEDKHGIVTDACASIGLSRSTFYKWKDTDPDFKAAIEEITEVAIDYVESKLFEKIEGVWIEGNSKDDDGEPLTYKQPPSDTAIIFYLKTKGKKRGYIEKSEIEHSGSIKTSKDLTDEELAAIAANK